MERVLKIEEVLSKRIQTIKRVNFTKQDIATYLNSLDKTFEKKQGKDFLFSHTKQIDIFVKLMFESVLGDLFKDDILVHNPLPLTLVAMGSYGREELCVYSDIDLMFVYEDVLDLDIESIIELIVQLVWDSGLKISHRVHRVDELLEASGQDITIKTAMIESRYLCGSKFLWIKIQEQFQRIRGYRRNFFLEEMRMLVQKRKKRYPLTMEPNIKEGAGGLRDAHTLFWIANVLHDVQKLSDFVPSVMNKREFKEFKSALEFLYRVRSALHLQAGKRQDVLNLDFIPNVARKLGFQDRALQSAQVALAKQTLQSLWSIKVISQICIKKITRSCFFNKANIVKLRKSYVEDGFYLYGGVLFTSYNRKPDCLHVMLRKFHKLEDRRVKFDISVINYIKNTKIPLKNSSDIYMIFSKFFQRKHLNQFLYAFYKGGILAALIKPMKHTINLPQFDGYHIYPVDIHSLRCVKKLENIEDIFVKSLFEDLCQNGKSLLKLTLLLHDIGKGRKGDHSRVGAKIFKHYAKKLSFSCEAIKMGDRLIRHHTLMSNVAYRQDIYSEKVIFSFIAALKTHQTLKLLYVLTYCDVSSVNESVYSVSNAKLLRELYEISSKAFSQDKLLGEASRRRRREKALLNNKDFKALSTIKQRKIMNISSNFFFLKYTSSKIVSIAKWAFEAKDISWKIETQKNLTFTIVSNQNINLSFILQKLSYLSVVHMEIFELFRHYKYFKIEFNEAVDEHDERLIEKLIMQSLSVTLKKPTLKPFIYLKDVKLNCTHSQTYALLSLKTKDQKGLLAYVIYVFEKFDLKISTAKIQTIKNRTRNMFLIEKQGILCDNSEKILSLLLSKKKKA